MRHRGPTQTLMGQSQAMQRKVLIILTCRSEFAKLLIHSNPQGFVLMSRNGFPTLYPIYTLHVRNDHSDPSRERR